MSFPPGRPIAVLTLAALVAGTAIAFRPVPSPGDLTLWVFSAAQQRQLVAALPDGTPPLVEQYRKATGRRVDVQLVASRALDVRLVAAIAAGQPSADIVAIEIGAVGKYFRGDATPFLPLEGRLGPAGMSRFLPNRLTTWTLNGHLAGLPDDVDPVSLTYRRDLFSAAGIDLESVPTWRQFQAACIAYERYWHAHGHPERRAVVMHRSSADELLMMLQQRRAALIDGGGVTHFDTPTVADTIAFYAQAAAGPEAIALDPSPGPTGWCDDLARGDAAVAFTPDWSIDLLRTQARALARKFAMRSLPIFDPGDVPTATWGGTMIALPRTTADPAAAWQAMQYLYLSEAAVRARRVTSTLLTARTDAEPPDVAGPPDSLFIGPPIRQIYATLARAAEPARPTAYDSIVSAALAGVLRRAIEEQVRQPALLSRDVPIWLGDADRKASHRIAFERSARPLP